MPSSRVCCSASYTEFCRVAQRHSCSRVRDQLASVVASGTMSSASPLASGTRLGGGTSPPVLSTTLTLAGMPCCCSHWASASLSVRAKSRSLFQVGFAGSSALALSRDERAS
jgi:hypothetical protein